MSSSSGEVASLLEQQASESDYYAVLGVEQTASQKEITKAYRLLSLKHHPDRCAASASDAEKAAATRNFQFLNKVYELLSDVKRRARYDKTGDVEDWSQDFQSSYEFWREKFNEVTEEDIRAFEREYRGSDEEANDLEELHEEFKGDMAKVLECLMCSRVEDIDRFKTHIAAAAKAGRVKAYTRTLNRTCTKLLSPEAQRERAEEAKEVAEQAARLSIGDEEGLRALIMKRQSERSQNQEGYLNYLADKYAEKEPPKKKQKTRKRKKNVF